MSSLIADIYQNKQFMFVWDIAKRFSGAKVFLVGGIVRDAILGRESRDYDFVVEGVSLDNLERYLNDYGKVVNVEGRAFGVLKFRPKESNQTFDVAIPRKERYLPGMRPKNAIVEHSNLSIDDDLSRRDFTINAMAIRINPKSKARNSNKTVNAQNKNSKQVIPPLNLPLSKGEKEGVISDCVSQLEDRYSNLYLIDPFGGLRDIDAKIIRAVGNPTERFLEDPARILRGVRFAAALGFLIEEHTLSAMKELKGEIVKEFKNEKGQLVPRVAPEVIGQEIIKTLYEDQVKFLELYNQTGLLELLLPEVAVMKGVEQPIEWHGEGDAYVHTRLVVENIPKDSSLELKLAALLHDIGKVTTKESSRATTRDLGASQLIGKSENQKTIVFYGHDKVSAEKAGKILRRYRFDNKMIEAVVWLIKNHMTLFFTFPQMRLSKQKAMARHPLFKELILLSQADQAASIRTVGKKHEFMPTVKRILAQIEEEEKTGKPREIISGDEIIEFLKQNKQGFDLQKEGRLVGDLKREVNDLYDEGKITGKEEALLWVKSRLKKMCLIIL